MRETPIPSIWGIVSEKRVLNGEERVQWNCSMQCYELPSWLACCRQDLDEVSNRKNSKFLPGWCAYQAVLGRYFYAKQINDSNINNTLPDRVTQEDFVEKSSGCVCSSFFFFFLEEQNLWTWWYQVLVNVYKKAMRVKQVMLPFACLYVTFNLHSAVVAILFFLRVGLWAAGFSGSVFIYNEFMQPVKPWTAHSLEHLQYVA